MGKKITVSVANPHGFCAGVHRAIEIVNKTLDKYGAPVYVRHEIVHNKYVVEELKQKGAVFVEDLSMVPEGSLLVFSAHGVSKKIENEAVAMNMQVIDATCPLVKKVHIEAQKKEKEGKTILMIGHEGHPEVEGTSGQVEQEVILVQSVKDVDEIKVKNPHNIYYITQTTLSIDDTRNIIYALKKKFPDIEGPELKDICFATQNRQEAVKKLAQEVDMILVLGSPNSSNSNRLRDLAQEMGVEGYLIDGAKDININWFKDYDKIGITAGASAPEILLEEVIDFLSKHFSITVKQMQGVIENVKFKLPKELVEGN